MLGPIYAFQIVDDIQFYMRRHAGRGKKPFYVSMRCPVRESWIQYELNTTDEAEAQRLFDSAKIELLNGAISCAISLADEMQQKTRKLLKLAEQMKASLKP